MKLVPSDEGPTLEITAARVSLETACDDLDGAVLALPDVHGDNVMASPSLVTLLLRVVHARREVRSLESVMAAETAERVWLATRH